MAYRTAEVQKRETIEAIILGQNDPMEEQLTAMGIIEQYFGNGKTEYKVFNTNEYYEDEEASTAQVGDAITKRSGSSWFEHTIIPKEEFKSTCEPIQGNNYMRRENIRYWQVGDEIEPEIQKLIYNGDLDINISESNGAISLRTNDLYKKSPIEGKIVVRQNEGKIKYDLISEDQFRKNYAPIYEEKEDMLKPTFDINFSGNLLTYCAKLGIGANDALYFAQDEIGKRNMKYKVDDLAIDYKKIQFKYAPNTMWKSCDIDKWNEKHEFNPFYEDINMSSYHETMYMLGEPNNDVAKVFMYNPEYGTACGQLRDGKLFYQHYMMSMGEAVLDRQSLFDTPENRKIIANMYYECDFALDNLIENITDKAINKNIKNIDFLFNDLYKGPKEIVQEWAMNGDNLSNIISAMENIQNSYVGGEELAEKFTDKLAHDFTVDKYVNTAAYCLKDPDKTRFLDLNEAYQYAKALDYKDQTEAIKELMDQGGIEGKPVNIILMKNKTNKVECGINTKGNLYLNVNGERKLSAINTPAMRLTIAKEYDKANNEAEQKQKDQYQNMVINKSVRTVPCR